jgi:hypothetical protein
MFVRHIRAERSIRLESFNYHTLAAEFACEFCRFLAGSNGRSEFGILVRSVRKIGAESNSGIG